MKYVVEEGRRCCHLRNISTNTVHPMMLFFGCSMMYLCCNENVGSWRLCGTEMEGKAGGSLTP
eukprot:8031228-Ditylum_brightwellii.AAC.2